MALVASVTATTAFGVENPTSAPASPPAQAVKAQASGLGPKIQFSTPIYDFGRVQAGEVVKHSYMFTNNGDQPLELSNVQPSCGCTTAGDWSRKVMPGQTGMVPVQFNSSHFNGAVFKTISVTSNDKQKPVTVLQLKGSIWKPLDLVPPYTVINVAPDVSSASASVRILNNTEEPISLSTPEINSKSFSATLTSVKPGKEFQLTLASVGELKPGNIQGKVLLKTSWTNNPILEVPFWANVQPALSIMPPRIMLPRPPLPIRGPTTITIQNNSTNALALSDPAINVPGVDLQIKEVQPGRIYHALLTFPQGFEMPAGQEVLFTMKSSNSRVPEIRVPVTQTPLPVARPHPVLAPPPLPTPQQPARAAIAKPATSGQATQ